MCSERPKERRDICQWMCPEQTLRIQDLKPLHAEKQKTWCPPRQERKDLKKKKKNVLKENGSGECTHRAGVKGIN